MQAPTSLERLLSERGDLWRGRQRRAGPALPTGRAALDDRLPDGGWPRGKLVELLPERFGVGELDLLLPCLAELTRRERPVLFVAPPLVPCPQALARAGLDLTRLVVVRHRQHAFWAAEQALKSGLCGAVVAWPATDGVDDRAREGETVSAPEPVELAPFARDCWATVETGAASWTWSPATSTATRTRSFGSAAESLPARR